MHVVGVDWSGRVRGEERFLWWAELDGDRPVRLDGVSRSEAAHRLVEQADADADLVAGLDFSFSMPAWFLEGAGIDGVDDLWSDTARLEGWLSACEPPFWGRPGRRCPPELGLAGWRATELAAAAIGPRPRSIFQVGGAGAVGTASLRGFPVLARLRAAGFHVWPFDPPTPPVVFEVWPRHHYGGALVKSSAAARTSASAALPAGWRAAATASDDAFDAAITAVALARRIDELPATPPPAHPQAQIEGWILGVPSQG